jgi:8-oxo-dGTP pyrophosphatase MutT (NUDIX family)
MPPSRSHIHATVTAYLSYHAGETQTLAPLLDALNAPDDPTSRSTIPGHVTCSAIVIDPDNRVLQIRHKITGRFLAPGGHNEPADIDLATAALRELSEETGIRKVPSGRSRHCEAFRSTLTSTTSQKTPTREKLPTSITTSDSPSG